jgi:hypothetical protein
VQLEPKEQKVIPDQLVQLVLLVQLDLLVRKEHKD